VFFESNGGQTKNAATIPEIRLGVAEPDIDIGNVETALEALTDSCYYLEVERNQYRFSLKENLNKRFADRRAGVKPEDIEKRIQEEILKVFPPTEGIERVFSPRKSNQIADRPVITFAVMGPDQSIQDDPAITAKIDTMTREYGTAARTYKSAVIWIVPETSATMFDEARKLLAWEDIEDEDLKLDDMQQKQLTENIKKAARDLKESSWRAYNKILLLGRDNTMRTIELGLVHSSAADSMSRFIINYLRQTDEIAKVIAPRTLVKNWPPAFAEWNTRGVRDMFYASPQFPRLLNQDAVKECIARGVSEGHLAYVSKDPKGGYSPFYYNKTLEASQVEISEDMFIITAEEAEKHIKPPELTRILVSPSLAQLQPGKKQTFTAKGFDQFGREFNTEAIGWTATGGEIDGRGVFKAGDDKGNFLVWAVSGKIKGDASVTIHEEVIGPGPEKPRIPRKSGTLSWSGEVPAQKWMNFYTKVLTRFVKDGSLTINVSFESSAEGGFDKNVIEETRSALRDIGMNENIKEENDL
jgi:hypothetical protein